MASMSEIATRRPDLVEVGTVTPEQVRRARLAVARGATSLDDCKELLAMLGLLPEAKQGSAA